MEIKPKTSQGDPGDGVHLLRSMTAHREYVAYGLESLASELRLRGLKHDLSKFRADEFEGFARINALARDGVKFGTPEYEASLRGEKSPVRTHHLRNSHHPEYWVDSSRYMGFIDIIEMVIDWYSANQTYEGSGSWYSLLETQKTRFADKFSESQWWLIEQVHDWIYEKLEFDNQE